MAVVPEAQFKEQYPFVRELGRGGMGVVYEARQVSLDRPVAVKMLSRDLAENKDFVTRFLEEARTVARMNHENIVNVIDCVESDENLYIVMELVQGRSLNHRLREEGVLPFGETLGLMSAAARALHHAHEAGVVHRDIKPENMMLDQSGRLKLMDFGVARLADSVHKTRAGTILGTPLYMAPEQAQGREVDRRADVYALGVVLFQMATGSLPFSAESAIQVAMKHVTTPPPAPRSLNPTIPPELEMLILRALEKEPAHRFQTALEMAEEMDGAVMRQAISGAASAIHSSATLVEGQALALPTGASEAFSAATMGSGVAVPSVQQPTPPGVPSAPSVPQTPTLTQPGRQVSEGAVSRKLGRRDYAIAAVLFVLGWGLALGFYYSSLRST